MPRWLKIATCSVAAAVLLAAVFYRFSSTSRPGAAYPDRTVQLSNSALLRIRSTLPATASDMVWELSYRGDSGWEKVDDWVVEGQMSWYGGNLVACPVGKLVVVVRADGSLVFVRSKAGRWETFHMEIPERAPFPLQGGTPGPAQGVSAGNSTSLETPALRELRARMSMKTSEGRIVPHLAQFLPDTRELWVDYLNREERRFRLQFTLAADGEKLEFLEMQERPFRRASDTSGPPFFFFLPDKSVPAACNAIELFR